MSQPISPAEELPPTAEAPRPRRQRRPPLAEVDTAELWQAWQRGEKSRVMPWLGLLTSFCVVLAAMYSFFFFSSTLTNDTGGGIVLTIAFAILILWLGRRISKKPGLSLFVIGFMVVVSGLAFGLWLLLCALSGWNALVAVAGTIVLGLIGAFMAVPSLNKIEQQSKSVE